MDRAAFDRIDRRRFLQAGAAATLTLAAGGLRSAVAEESQGDPFAGFTLGVQSYTFREFDLEQTLKRIQSLGLHYAELYNKHAPLNSSPAQIKAIRRLCSDYGVVPIAFGVQRFGKDHAANQKAFEFGQALGIKTFSADPDPESFDSLDRLCDEYRIAVAIHPHGPVGNRLHRWYSAQKIQQAVKDHHPLIGSCLDTGHLIRSAQAPFNEKLDPAEQVRVMGVRNFGMHLKDHDNERRRDVVYGQGALDVPAVLRALKPYRAWAYISIEYEANPQEPTDDVKACVAAFKEAVRKLA